jgi:hypothetical protein
MSSYCSRHSSLERHSDTLKTYMRHVMHRRIHVQSNFHPCVSLGKVDGVGRTQRNKSKASSPSSPKTCRCKRTFLPTFLTSKPKKTESSKSHDIGAGTRSLKPTVRPKTQVPRRNSSLTKLSLPTSFFPPCITPRRGESTTAQLACLLYNIRVSVGPFTRNAGLGSVFLPMLVRQLGFSLLSVLMSVVIGSRAEWSCCSGSREVTKR